MKNKIIVLMAIIPLVMLFTILSMTNAVALAFNIPVKGIEISTETDDGVLAIDMADFDDIYLDVKILPLNAANDGYSISYNALENSASAEAGNSVSGGKNSATAEAGNSASGGKNNATAEVENSASGEAENNIAGEVAIDPITKLITPKKLGKVKVTVTSNDGGFKDSIIILVSSSKALDFVVKFVDENIEMRAGTTTDFEADIKSGSVQFASEIAPKNIAASVEYFVTDVDGAKTDKFEINSLTGRANAKFSGEYIVTAIVQNGIKDGVATSLKKTVKVNVAMAETESGLTVNGFDSHSMYLPPSATELEFFVESVDGRMPSVSCVSPYFDGARILYLGGRNYKCELALKGKPASGESVSVVINDGVKKDYILTIEFQDYSLSVFTKHGMLLDDGAYIKSEDTLQFFADITPLKKGVSFKWSVDNANVLEASPASDSAFCVFTAKAKSGSAVVTVDAMLADGLIATKSFEVKIVEGCSEMLFTETSKTYGIGNTYAIGNKVLNGTEYSNFEYACGLKLFKNTTSTLTINEDIEYLSSNKNIAYISTIDGCAILHIVGAGRVTLKARWIYASKFNESVFASLTLDCVDEGVNIGTVEKDNFACYKSLKKATEDGKKVVLQNNIMLGQSIYDSNGKILGNAGSILQAETTVMPTTADWTYYKNVGKPQPTVRYCIEFKNDVYGNGFELNADYITNTLDGSMQLPDVAVFRGPLWFVRLENVAAVMEQDNIVFLVRTDNVKIDNAVLKGCLDESLVSDIGGSIDLSRLNYSGTTLELMADVDVVNCRISNGRTTVRAFGRDGVDKATAVDVLQERMDIKIASSIISQAREFLVKIGSNRTAKYESTSTNETSAENLTPYLGNKLPLGRKGTEDKQLLDDSDFQSKFTLTYLTLENSALETSGLFAVGFQSCFGGLMLNGCGYQFPGWQNIAGTSYPAVLKLKGDVRIYDWKQLDNIDSSTLIELEGEAKDFLKLDIKKILEVAVGHFQGFENLLDTVDGVKYAHGGIAFYGGGKNYSMLDISEYKGFALTKYLVNIDMLTKVEDGDLMSQGKMLPLAAGTENFRFFMFDSKSGFTYKSQKEYFEKGTAYDFISAYYEK